MTEGNSIKVAVTGASGFIGRYVIEDLLAREVSVIAITRNKHKLAEFAKRVKIIELDMENLSDSVFTDVCQPDVLIHLAWEGLPNYDSLHHFETELPRQYDFLRKMILGGLSSVVVSGTCFEYGMQSGSLSESIDAKPENSYGFAKDVLRKKLGFLKKIHQFKLTWARLFYIYGDDQPKTSLLPQLRNAVESGATHFNMSRGEQLRDYLHVRDVASNLVVLALKYQDIGLVNVCSGEPCSVRSLVEQWIRQNNWCLDLNLGFYPYPTHEPMAFWGDGTKLKAILAQTKAVDLPIH